MSKWKDRLFYFFAACVLSLCLLTFVGCGFAEAHAAKSRKPMYEVTVYNLRQGAYGSRDETCTVYVSSLSELIPEDETAKAYGLLKISSGSAIYYVDPSNVEICYY